LGACFFHPAHEPSDRCASPASGRSIIHADQPRFGSDRGVCDFGGRKNVAYQVLGAFGYLEDAAPQPVKKFDLLQGADPQVSIKPEIIYGRTADIAIAVIKLVFMRSAPMRGAIS
jgi:hypothetical protein